MREYSDCVGELYPRELSADATVGLKVLFVIALAGMVGGAWWWRRYNQWSGWEAAIMMGVAWFLGAPLAVGFAVGVLLGIRWLFT